MFRSRLRMPRLRLSLLPLLPPPPSARRRLHRMPTLDRHDLYARQGVPGLMSPPVYDVAWTQYMGWLIERLNECAQDAEFRDLDPKTISIMTAREPQYAHIFNYASMAHNNHVFFDSICPNGSPMPSQLKSELEASFSSLDSLREQFVTTAHAMFGPGFIWLLKCGTSFRLLTTYLAGSPYPEAHWRTQSVDMNTVDKITADDLLHNRKQQPSCPINRPDEAPASITLEPLLCLNTWEHAWMLDYGFGNKNSGGKAAYAEAWWDLIDWERICARAGLQFHPYKKADEGDKVASEKGPSDLPPE